MLSLGASKKELMWSLFWVLHYVIVRLLLTQWMETYYLHPGTRNISFDMIDSL